MGDTAPDRPGPTPPQAQVRSASAVALRVICHLIAEVPPFVIAGIQISKGWIPTSDDAVIAWRTWSVFSGPTPLDGQFTQITAAGHHAAFDLGPLQYFLLAIPDRIDPVHGILWGSALVIAAMAALAIEAAWSASGAVAGAVAASILALMTATMIQSSVNLAWNPSVGAYAFAATLATSFAVARGRMSWLPVAVAVASLAAQSHVSFVLPSLACVAVGLILGIAEHRRALFRPLLISAAVGVACFLAPIIQQLSSRPGNITVIAGNLSRLDKTVGIGAGLRGVGTATAVAPSWWVRIPPVTSVSAYSRFESTVYARPEAWGIISLVLAVAIAVVAYATRRRALAALAALGATTGLAAAYTLGSVPGSQAAYLVYYLYFCLWPIGMVIMASFAGAIWSVGAGVLGHRRATGAAEDDAAASRAPAVANLAAALVLGLGGAALVVNDAGYGKSGLFLNGWQPVHQVAALVVRVEHVIAPSGAHRPFVVEYDTGLAFVNALVEESLAYELVVRGYDARVRGAADEPLGPGYTAPPGSPVLSVRPEPHDRFAITWTPARGR